jgi:putative membrane protein
MSKILVTLSLLFVVAFCSAADATMLNEDDRTFVQKATVAGMLEIKTAKAALERNLTADERAFAQRVVDDHTAANKELAKIAKDKNYTPPKELTADKLEELNDLQAVKDSDFNESFLEQQIDCHKDAIDLFEDQAEDGTDVDLKNFASKTLPKLKQHLETAKKLEEKY